VKKDRGSSRVDSPVSSLGMSVVVLHMGYLLTSMYNVLVVEVVDRFEDLLDCLRSILLCKFSLVANPVEELAAGG
jgi:hypothetical protein